MKGSYSLLGAACAALVVLAGASFVGGGRAGGAFLSFGALLVLVPGYAAVRALLACAYVHGGDLVYIGCWHTRRIPLPDVVEVRLEPLDPTAWVPNLMPVLVLRDGSQVRLFSLASTAWRGRNRRLERFAARLA